MGVGGDLLFSVSNFGLLTVTIAISIHIIISKTSTTKLAKKSHYHTFVELIVQ